MNVTVELANGREKGSGLVEVMIALLIMLFLMVGILQMFSMAFLMNFGAAARTDMTYKCQAVVENLRMVKYLRKNGDAIVNDPTTTIPAVFATTTTPQDLPGADSAFWGPSGANVLGNRYNLSYTIVDGATKGATNFWIVTVSAVANTAVGSNRYLGAGIARRIDYVAQIPKP